MEKFGWRRTPLLNKLLCTNNLSFFRHCEIFDAKIRIFLVLIFFMLSFGVLMWQVLTKKKPFEGAVPKKKKEAYF